MEFYSQEYTLSTAFKDVTVFEQLTDESVDFMISNAHRMLVNNNIPSHTEGLKKAQALLARYNRRDLYKTVWKEGLNLTDKSEGEVGDLTAELRASLQGVAGVDPEGVAVIYKKIKHGLKLERCMLYKR